MELKEIRERIDRIDPQIRTLLMERLDCSRLVAQTKIAMGETTIYRADREAEILKRLGEGVPADRLDEYTAVVRKIMQSSRMYQYGLLFDSLSAPLEGICSSESLNVQTISVTVRLAVADRAGALSSVLGTISDYGFSVARMIQLTREGPEDTVAFELMIRGDLSQTRMQKLIFQLSKECGIFRVISAETQPEQ